MSAFNTFKTLYDNNPKVREFIKAAKDNDVYRKGSPFEPGDIIQYYTSIVTLLRIEFDGATLRLCDNVGSNSIIYEGEEYISDGSLGEFKNTDESAELNTRGVTIELIGESDTLMYLFNNRKHIRAPVKVYTAYMGASGPNTPDLVIPTFSGYVDKPTVQSDNNGSSMIRVNISTVSMLQALSDNSAQRTAHALQIAKEPGDNFFKYAASTQDMKKKTWKN
ncbi:hypothetical protein CF138_17225 [Aeromonas hydrophila]|uniref:hypothetical protein n=1 Tax=Aeromonas TaxID=642 RepID=UPI0011174FB2|nr:hypothetical protein [Aeromonas hydrophila]TNH82842.1 hypothetical protein CF138_17225 [Aeromonas hydrophila]TNI00227.1 hypothetical protein CF136_10530 [Aeromonas hydrophila]TNI92892.1 hypothetical protein CF118_18110 [Aeromonas hydrophila]